VDEAVPLTKRKRIYGQPIDVSTAMIRLFGGEVLDIPSQDFNLTSGSYMQEDDTNLKIVMSEESVQIIAISEDDGIVFQGFTIDDIGQAQWEDPGLRLILNFLKNQVEPEGNELFLSSPGAKIYWINKEMFLLDKHGVLRNTSKKEGARTRLVIPAKLRETVMELCHELPSAVHQDTKRTLSRVKDKFHWYNMSRDIRTFVLTCEVCSKHNKPTRNARCQMTPYHAGAPMERVHLDFMGHLPKTKKGNEYVLMMVTNLQSGRNVFHSHHRQLRSLHKLRSTHFLHGLGILFRSSQIKAVTSRVSCLKLYVICSKYIRLVQRLIDRPLMVRWKGRIEA
jgi:hypothetical protein